MVSKIVELSRDFADLLRSVRHSQKSPAAKNRITGSAIYKPLKMADKTRQKILPLVFKMLK